MTQLPGDPSPRQQIARMIRVDHAGEYAARQIYRGQLAILGRRPAGDTIRHMYEQEKAHLARFETLIAERHVRPTALLPLWHLAGLVLGAATATLGERAAMACTVAVEETIDQHYQSQSNALDDSEKDLRDTIDTFRAEELEHRDIGLDHGAEQTPAYHLLTTIIRTGCRVAIALSERI